MTNPTVNENQTVAQIVLDHSECAQVFRHHRIDFCCRGEQTLVEACRQRAADLGEVLVDLDRAIAARQKVAVDDPRQLSDAALVDRIVRRHHRYLRDALPFLTPLAKKVARVHGAHNANLLDVRDCVEELAELLVPHLDREEEILFPALLAPRTPQAQGVIDRELATMRDDHLELSALLERLRNAAHDYAVPDWACTSYSTLFRELTAVEADLFTHVHLENHVLMPRFVRG